MGITIVPNASLELDKLIARAIKNVAPFHETDRGFKDTMILESVAAHASLGYSGGNVVLVSSDGRLREGAASLADQCPEIVVIELEYAPGRLEQCIDDAVKASLAKEAAIAKELLEANLDLVFDHVRRQKVPAPAVPFGHSLSGLASIHCIQNVHPLSLDWVTPTRHFSNNCSIGDSVDIECGVAVDIDVIIRKMDSHPPPCTYVEPFYWENQQANIALAPWADVTETIRDTVTIHATARVVEASRLADLQLISNEEHMRGLLSEFLQDGNSP